MHHRTEWWRGDHTPFLRSPSRSFHFPDRGIRKVTKLTFAETEPRWLLGGKKRHPNPTDWKSIPTRLPPHRLDLLTFRNNQSITAQFSDMCFVVRWQNQRRIRAACGTRCGSDDESKYGRICPWIESKWPTSSSSQCQLVSIDSRTKPPSPIPCMQWSAHSTY
jgi:hypothetical protein